MRLVRFAGLPVRGSHYAEEFCRYNGGNCIEAGSAAGRVLVRDTKNRPGAVLAFAPQTWREFAARIKNSAA